VLNKEVLKLYFLKHQANGLQLLPLTLIKRD
jgi:hypothetical protein